MTRVRLLAVPVDPISFPELLAEVADAVSARRRRLITYANVHVLNQSVTDEGLRAFLNRADVVFCDGNGARLGARLVGAELPHRMTGADWIWELAERAAREGWRLYWIGGEPGVTEAAAEALKARFPALILGFDHGFHARSGPEDEACVQAINDFYPDIILVGMGTPEQERWVEARAGRLQAPVIWCLGATADFVSGRVRRGPRWLTDRAEWLDRLISDPGRLWRRYLLGNGLFLARVLASRIRGEA